MNNIYSLGSTVFLFERNEKGELNIREDSSFRPYFYVENEKGPYKSIYGERLEKIKCSEPYDVFKTRSNYNKTFEADVHYTNRYIIDKIKDFGNDPLRKHFLDIEISNDFGVLDVENAPDSVLGLCVYDNFLDEYHQFIWHEKIKRVADLHMKKILSAVEEENIFIHLFDSEEEMLGEWMVWERKHTADIWWGWYAGKFDYPYLFHRIGERNINFVSPIEIAREDKFGISLAGIYLGDLLEHYKKLTEFLHGQRESYSLNYISQIELGKGKRDVYTPKMIKKLWKENPEEFIIYNVIDVKREKQIEEKYKISEYVNNLRKVSHSRFEDTLQYAKMVDCFMLYYAHNNMKIVLPTKTSVKDESKQGPYVSKPEKGLYENVVVFDLSNLYPRILRSLNLSPETEDENGEILVNGKRFKKEPMGFFPAVVKCFEEERMKMKNKMFEVGKKSKLFDEFDMKQRALKALTNAVIGYLGYRNSRFYNKDVFEAVTHTATYIQKETEKFIKERNLGHVKYQDSLDYSRQIIIKDSEGKIEFIPIGEFVEEKKNHQEYETLAFDIEKREIMFKSIKKAIFHEYKEKLLRFSTNRGRTIVTPQHSIYKYENEKIELCDAKELKIGDYLISLTKVPKLQAKYKEGDVLDITKLNYFSSFLRGYKDKMKFSAKEGKCPYCKKICKNLASHVHFRHSDRKYFFDEIPETCKYVGGENAKTGRIPRHWKLSKEFAWILGFWCADGSVSTKKSGTRWLISFGNQNLNIIKRVKRFFDSILGTDLKIIESVDKRTNKTMFYYRIPRKVMVIFFMEGLGMNRGSEFKKVPFIILNGDENLKRSFIEGYLEGDGWDDNKRYKSRFLAFCSKSSYLSNQVHYLLKQMDFGKNQWGRPINDVSYQYRKDKPKIKTIRTTTSKKSSYNEWNFTPARINEIMEVIPEKNRVYDLEIEDLSNFVDAEGLILVHNTDSLFCRIELEEKSVDMIEYGKEILKKINLNLDNVAREFGIEDHFFEYKFEKIYEKLFFTDKKKRYCGLLSWKEGEKRDEIEIVGFETRRSDVPQATRKFQKKLFELVLRESKKEKIDDFVLSTWNNYKKLPLDMIGFPVNFNKPLDRYKTTPIHIRAIKNAMELGIDFSVGEKFKWVYVIPNINYRCGVMAFNEIHFSHMKVFAVDYGQMKRRLSKVIGLVYNTLEWSVPGGVVLNGEKGNKKMLNLFAEEKIKTQNGRF